MDFQEFQDFLTARPLANPFYRIELRKQILAHGGITQRQYNEALVVELETIVDLSEKGYDLRLTGPVPELPFTASSDRAD